MNNINWYPGHMKKTRELIQQNLKLVDAVIEVIDARIPLSSRKLFSSKRYKSFFHELYEWLGNKKSL